ncbi:MAG: SDR family NAD(P)-dependent oxidoreductase [Kiloniellales bacterium]|nr:SDR family NAD(P)-dependent oxidoreductase [Kiloniellales bacterium]
MSEAKAQKRVWITGASSGLGRALALKMAAEGWQVAISARSEDQLQAVAALASAFSGKVEAFPLDVTVQTDVQATVARLVEDFGLPDLVVLNAGTHKPTPAASLAAEDFRRLVDLNLMGTVHCLEAILPPLRERQNGQIAIVASLAGYVGLPLAGAYGMTKAGLINLAEALEPELRAEGIKLQIVNPGFVRTPLTDRNPFHMPFLMEVEAAAEAFYRGLRSGAFEIIFPRRFAYLLKLLRILPYPLALAMTRRLLPKR